MDGRLVVAPRRYCKPARGEPGSRPGDKFLFEPYQHETDSQEFAFSHPIASLLNHPWTSRNVAATSNVAADVRRRFSAAGLRQQSGVSSECLVHAFNRH